MNFTALPKEETHNLFKQLPKLIPLYWNNNFVLMATNLKPCLGVATPSAAYLNFNISDG